MGKKDGRRRTGEEGRVKTGEGRTNGGRTDRRTERRADGRKDRRTDGRQTGGEAREKWGGKQRRGGGWQQAREGERAMEMVDGSFSTKNKDNKRGRFWNKRWKFVVFVVQHKTTGAMALGQSQSQEGRKFRLLLFLVP
jgi:hypothetical protein